MRRTDSEDDEAESGLQAEVARSVVDANNMKCAALYCESLTARERSLFYERFFAHFNNPATAGQAFRLSVADKSTPRRRPAPATPTPAAQRGRAPAPPATVFRRPPGSSAEAADDHHVREMRETLQQLVQANESRPTFLNALFDTLLKLDSDYLRQRALISLQDLVQSVLHDELQQGKTAPPKPQRSHKGVNGGALPGKATSSGPLLTVSSIDARPGSADSVSTRVSLMSMSDSDTEAPGAASAAAAGSAGSRGGGPERGSLAAKAGKGAGLRLVHHEQHTRLKAAPAIPRDGEAKKKTTKRLENGDDDAGMDPAQWGLGLDVSADAFNVDSDDVEEDDDMDTSFDLNRSDFRSFYGRVTDAADFEDEMAGSREMIKQLSTYLSGLKDGTVFDSQHLTAALKIMTEAGAPNGAAAAADGAASAAAAAAGEPRTASAAGGVSSAVLRDVLAKHLGKKVSHALIDILRDASNALYDEMVFSRVLNKVGGRA